MLGANPRTAFARSLTRVLVLGGYGGFGGRISQRLAAAGHEVIVAGRNEAKARVFCGGDPALVPALVDRVAVAKALAEHRPDTLVDASGPFQALDHVVPRACIEAGVNYLDIADGRAFVCGIAGLDAAAKAAGVIVISGASSVPALSGAVVRQLTAGMTRVDAVEMAISASNRAAAGPAVAASILSQTGQTLRVWLGRRWTTCFGWQSLERVRFEIEGQCPIAGRLVGLVDVPDLELLPARLPGRPAIVFRAGTELTFQNLALWFASWPVRWRIVRSLTPFARLLRPLQRLTAKLGSDRSAMVVRVFGRIGDKRLERRWTLIANDGDGPEIPTLSIVPLVARIVEGSEPPGARDAGQCLSLTDYQPAFDRLSIVSQTSDYGASSPLYARVMGTDFDRLPSSVRAMHDVLRDGGASGSAKVTGASSPVATLIARMIGFPREGTYAAHVHFIERDGVERWTRTFGEHSFQSELSQRGGCLVERFGSLRFAFDLALNLDGLTMVMRRWWLGPLPMPLALAPRSPAREWEESGRFHFDVPITLPLIGTLVHYRGWLEKS